MNRALVDRIAAAVLYEGYMLYPYRPALKNRQRWTFGGVYPQAYSLIHGETDPSVMQTECLVHGSAASRIEVTIRFLHLTARLVGRLDQPVREWPANGAPTFQVVESFQVDDKIWQSWQEAEERTIVLPETPLADLLSQPRQHTFGFPARRQAEPLWTADGEIVGVLMREQQAIEGSVEWSAEPVAADLFKVRATIRNCTPLQLPEQLNRDEALLRALVSTHTILGVRDGEFVSLIDPPERWRAAAALCKNVGAWPVLVGEAGETDTLLSSPIILYDYPQVAPESPGDFFDGTEMDEMLALRILTLTDDEKQAMAGVDERARALLQRTEALAPEQWLGLHGTIRGLRHLPAEVNHD